jgi:hypothetical protein
MDAEHLFHSETYFECTYYVVNQCVHVVFIWRVNKPFRLLTCV